MGNYKDLNDYEVMYLIEESNDDARDILFEKYKPVVLATANKYKYYIKECGLELDDLIQEGYLGLYNAIRNYNSSMNVKFYTYAVILIRSKIMNCLTVKNSCKHKNLNSSISLFTTLSSYETGTLMDIIEDKNAVSPHFFAEESELEECIRQFMLSLEFRQSIIFEMKLNGFCNADISKLLDYPIKSVANTIFRLRQRFRSYLLNC